MSKSKRTSEEDAADKERQRAANLEYARRRRASSARRLRESCVMCPTNGEPPLSRRSQRLDSVSTTSLSTTPSEDGSGICEVLVCFGTTPAGLLERLSSALRAWGRPRRWPHWAVVLSYSDDKVLYCCGSRDPRTGGLVGTATWRTAAQLQAMDVHRISLGEHNVSPDQLHEAMIGLCGDGQYRAVHNDSQTWAAKLLNRLSLDIPE